MKVTLIDDLHFSNTISEKGDTFSHFFDKMYQNSANAAIGEVHGLLGYRLYFIHLVSSNFLIEAKDLMFGKYFCPPSYYNKYFEKSTMDSMNNIKVLQGILFALKIKNF